MATSQFLLMSSPPSSRKMLPSEWFIYRLAIVAMCLLGFLGRVSAATVEYCSEINTADTGKNTSIYQSHGLCTGFCNQDYAFAVLQYDGCWCSDYAPSSTSTGCDTTCPGYGFEDCGGDELFGYIALSMSPSGTKGAAEFATTSKSSQSTTTSSETMTESSRSSTSNFWTPTPIISLETITGQVRTVTVTPTVPPNSQNVNGISRQDGDSGGLGTGGAVGLTVGLVALIAIVGGIAFFCYRRRKQRRAEEYNNASKESVTGLGGPVPSRTMSENSRYLLGTDGRQVVETWENDNREEPGSRRSRLMPVDPRLDPFAPVYQRGENKSRESVNTLRDDHDYSRRVHGQGPILRATNPDE